MYHSNRSFNIPPRAYPGHLTPFLAREGGNLIITHRGWGILIADLDVMLRDKSWRRRRRRQTLMNSQEKDCVFVADWLKTKGLHKLCSVFEGV